jgi:hypothetical protein
MQALMERAESEGRFLTSDERLLFDAFAEGVDILDAIAAKRERDDASARQWLLSQVMQSFRSQAPIHPEPTPAPIPTQAKHVRYQPDWTHADLGDVKYLADEIPTHSTLSGGHISGWHPDVVPFSEMAEVPGLGLMMDRKKRRRLDHV